MGEGIDLDKTPTFCFEKIEKIGKSS